MAVCFVWYQITLLCFQWFIAEFHWTAVLLECIFQKHSQVYDHHKTWCAIGHSLATATDIEPTTMSGNSQVTVDFVGAPVPVSWCGKWAVGQGFDRMEWREPKRGCGCVKIRDYWWWQLLHRCPIPLLSLNPPTQLYLDFQKKNCWLGLNRPIRAAQTFPGARKQMFHNQ